MKSASPCGINLARESEVRRSHQKWLSWTLPLLVCAALSGCQKSLLQNVSETPVVTAFKEVETFKPEIPAELEGLNVYLSQDLWVKNHHWSPYDEWKTLRDLKTTELSAPHNHRWLFGVKQDSSPLQQVAQSVKTTDKSAQAEQVADATTPEKSAGTEKPTAPNNKSAAESWSFNALHDFFHREEDSEPTHKSQKIAALQQLAAHDTLAGWNGTILWATLAPRTAADTIPTLEKLVCEADQRSDSESKSDKKKKASASTGIRLAALNGLSLVLAHADALPIDTKQRLTQLLSRPDISFKL